MTSHLEAILIRTADYVEKRCMSSSDSDTDSTVIGNSDGSQNVETGNSGILKDRNGKRQN